MESTRVETLGRYRLIEEIGKGGHGHVYRALDPLLQRSVALKELKASLLEDPKARERFLFEARAVAQLKHPNIAAVYEFGEDQGFDFIAFEFVEGRTLKAILEAEGVLAPPRALEMLRQLCEALDYAHARKVVHCDLKPGNIIVNQEGEPSIVDFGLAWLARPGNVTETQTLIGTPRYMSPEQIRGGELDGRADLYSLAFVFYEMLAGRPPFADETYATLLSKQLQTLPPSLSERNPRFGAPIDEVLAKAMAKAPGDRYATGARFYQAAAEAMPLARRVRPWRKMTLIGAILSLSCALLLSMAWGFRVQLLTTVDNLRSPAAPDPGAVWPGDFGDQAQAHNVALLSTLQPAPRWTFELPSANKDALVGIVAAQQKVVVGLRNGKLEALNWSDGGTVWKTSLDSALTGPPCLAPGKGKAIVVVATEAEELVAYSLSDGKEVWRVKAEDVPGGLYGGVTLGDDGQLYGASVKGRVVVIKPGDGDFRWFFDLADLGECWLAPALSDAAVFVAFDNGTLVAMERSSREVAWKVNLDGSPVALSVNRNLGIVLAATESGQVCAYSLLTGKSLWKAPAPGGILGLEVSIGTVIATCKDGHVYSWSCRSGTPQWLVRLDSPPTGPPLSDTRVILVPTESGLRYLEPGTGQDILKRRLALEGARHPAVLGSWLLLASGDRLSAFAP